jgi:hypothetical protein
MHRTCDVAGRPAVTATTTEWIDRVAPEDPLLDAHDVEIPPAERIRARPRRRVSARMATAAAIVVAEVDEFVEIGAIDPEEVVTPGVFVDRVVRKGAPK